MMVLPKITFVGPLEYLQVLATTLVSLLFIYVIPIDCKITKFSFTFGMKLLLVYLNFLESVSVQEGMFLNLVPKIGGLTD